MTIVPMPLEFLAFAFAPQSLVAPFAALTIVLNQLFAPLVLPEELTLTKIMATAVIVVGLVTIALATSGHSEQMTTDELLNRYFEVDYLLPALVLVFAIAMVICVIHFSAAVGCPDATPSMYAFVAAGFNTFLQTLSKSLGEMSRSTDTRKLFTKSYAYLHIVLILSLGMLVVSYVNRGLAKFDTVLVSPLYICCLIVLSSLYGAIFFKEYENYSLIHILLWVLGLFVVCSGVMLLTLSRFHIRGTVVLGRRQRPTDMSYSPLEDASTSTGSNSDMLD